MSAPDFASILTPLFDLRGKVAVVTGAATGMGRASADLLAMAGAIAILADTDEDKCASAISAITARGGAAEFIYADMVDEASVGSLFAEIQRRFARLDIMVNGITQIFNRPLLETTTEEWEKSQAINLRSAFFAMRAGVPLMIGSGGGRIVNITTIGGRHPVLNGNAAYSSAKAGLNMLTLNAALDFAPHGITVNAVLPGAIPTEDTPNSTTSLSGPGVSPGRHLLGQGTPAEVAALVLLLVSPAGRFINGQQIAVDGGFLLS